MSHALAKREKLEQVRRLLIASYPEGVSITEIQRTVGAIDFSSIHRYINDDLHATRIRRGIYTLRPTAEDVKFAEEVLAAMRRADELTDYGRNAPPGMDE